MNDYTYFCCALCRWVGVSKGTRRYLPEDLATCRSGGCGGSIAVVSVSDRALLVWLLARGGPHYG